jgi:hypothetical protein
VARMATGSTEAWGRLPPRRSTAMLCTSLVSCWPVPPLDRFHVEGVSEPTGPTLAGAQLGEPILGEQAFDGDDPIVPIGCDCLEKRLRVRLQVAMERDLAGLVKETSIHRPSVPVDATTKRVRLGVESHEGSPS